MLRVVELLLFLHFLKVNLFKHVPILVNFLVYLGFLFFVCHRVVVCRVEVLERYASLALGQDLWVLRVVDRQANPVLTLFCVRAVRVYRKLVSFWVEIDKLRPRLLNAELVHPLWSKLSCHEGLRRRQICELKCKGRLFLTIILEIERLGRVSSADDFQG